MSKKFCFTNLLEKEHGKRAKTLLKSKRQRIYHKYWSLWRQLGWKTFLRVICKILELFANPLTADGKYSLLNRGNLLQHFQVQLSQKRKTFCEYFFWVFLKFTFNFQHFQRKDDPHSWCIFELTNSQKRGEINV